MHYPILLTTICLLLTLTSCTNTPTVRTIIFDAKHQPPYAGAVIDNYDESVITGKGIIVAQDSTELTIADSTTMHDAMRYTSYNDDPRRYRAIDCTRVNKDQYWCPLMFLLGDTDYYVRAFIRLSDNTVVYGQTEHLHTIPLNRYKNFNGYANVFFQEDFDLFDKDLDEKIEWRRDGYYYSYNEIPGECYFTKSQRHNTSYKFRTEWGYLMWYYHGYIEGKDEKDILPTMQLKDGRMHLDVPEGYKVFYCIDDTTENPLSFTDVYEEPIEVPSGTHRIDCFSLAPDGTPSHVNRYFLSF